jgi:tRNA(Glu) U13 pseudouridine synthase TruD
MKAARRQQLIKRRAVAKASLTRMQNFLKSGDLKVNEIKVRLDKLSSILNKLEVALISDEFNMFVVADVKFKKIPYYERPNSSEDTHPFNNVQ